MIPNRKYIIIVLTTVFLLGPLFSFSTARGSSGGATIGWGKQRLDSSEFPLTDVVAIAAGTRLP